MTEADSRDEPFLELSINPTRADEYLSLIGLVFSFGVLAASRVGVPGVIEDILVAGVMVSMLPALALYVHYERREADA